MSIKENRGPWRIHSTKTIYQNPWIEVLEHEVTNPSGGRGIYGVVSPKNFAIGIIPLDKDYNTWIVGQYRFSIDQYSWEIPEGGGLKSIHPLESAKRELKEETGIEAEEWKQVLECYTSNSIMDEKGLIYVARNLKIGPPFPGETEDLTVKKLRFEELVHMAYEGKISDALALSGIFKVKLLIERGDL